MSLCPIGDRAICRCLVDSCPEKDEISVRRDVMVERSEGDAEADPLKSGNSGVGWPRCR